MDEAKDTENQGGRDETESEDTDGLIDGHTLEEWRELGSAEVAVGACRGNRHYVGERRRHIGS